MVAFKLEINYTFIFCHVWKFFDYERKNDFLYFIKECYLKDF